MPVQFLEDIVYSCIKCGWTAPKGYDSMVCECGGDMRPDSVPGVLGTQDSFGIGRKFIDERTGKEIKTWKAWEKAGYKDAMSYCKPKLRNRIKRKVDKITKYDKGSKSYVMNKGAA